MGGSKQLLIIESKITQLRLKLNGLMGSKSKDSDKVMELSRELDLLIVGYCNLKNQIQVDV